jgi:hypothetical protein
MYNARVNTWLTESTLNEWCVEIGLIFSTTYGYVSGRDFCQQSPIITGNSGANHGNPAAYANRLGNPENRPALLITQHNRMEIHSNHEFLLTGFFVICAIGGTCGQIVGERYDYAAVDVARGILVMRLNLDGRPDRIIDLSMLHPDIAIERDLLVHNSRLQPGIDG